MYVKVLQPKSHGKKAYDNAGKSAQAVHYLQHEAKENGQEAVFFTQKSDDISGEQVQHLLDTNVKGLGKTDAKFYSLVISPSAEELALMGNDPQKLREYTRSVMQQYAENFTFKDGKKMGADNLVWAATQHNAREYRGDSGAVQVNEARSGQPKEGLQTHIHIVVSARDAAQKVTLNPMSKPDRFDRVAWAAKAGVQFTERYGAVEQGHTPASVATEKARIKGARPVMGAAEVERRERKVGERVAAVNQLLPPEEQLRVAQVYEAGRARQYDRIFYKGLSRVEAGAAQGVPVQEPYALLRTGRKADPWSLAEARQEQRERGFSGPAAGPPRIPARPLSQGLLRASNRDIMGAARRLQDLNRGGYTQDISGDRDKDRGGVERG